jgi:hypothetical protein
MKNVFRIPPSPFQIQKSASQPAVSNPSKESRPSNASSDDTPSKTSDNQNQGADKFDQQVKQMGSFVYKDQDQSSDGLNNPRIGQHSINSDHTGVNEALVHHLDSDSQSQDQFTTMFTPPPSSSSKRKRRSSERRDEHRNSSSKKHKRSLESSIQYPEQLPPKSPSKKDSHKSRKSSITSSPNMSENAIGENPEETTSIRSKREKDERRALMKEKKLERRKKLERQSSETGSQQRALSSLRNEITPNENIGDPKDTPTNGVTVNHHSRVFEFESQSPEPPPKSSAKKRKKQKREVLASVEPQSTEEVDLDIRDEYPISMISEHSPKPQKELSNKEDKMFVEESEDELHPLDLRAAAVQESGSDEPVYLASQEIPEYGLANSPDTDHGSSQKRRKRSQSHRHSAMMKSRSLEKIVDSSADEEEVQEATPKRRNARVLAGSQFSSNKLTPDGEKSEEGGSLSNVKPGKGYYTPEECDVVEREVKDFLLVSTFTVHDLM